MLTSGWRSPVAFSISTDVVSSRLERKTRVLAMFRERPVSINRSTRVSSLRLRRTSLLVCISPPIINLTIYISSDGRDAARCGTRFRDDSGGRDVFDPVLWLAAMCSFSEASNPLIEGLRCTGAPVGLHEDAPPYSRLLSLLQQAHGARRGARQEPSAVGTPSWAKTIPTRDRGIRRRPAFETPGPGENDATDPFAVALPGAQEGTPAGRHPGEEVPGR